MSDRGQAVVYAMAMSDKKTDKKPDPTPFSAFVRYENAGSATKDKNKIEDTYGKYLFGDAYIDPNDPNAVENAAWSNNTLGRTMTRLFSRGILGATFFTLGNHAVRHQMPGYSPEVAFEALGGITKYPLRYIARGIDNSITPMIKSYVRMISPAEKAAKYAEDAVWFRKKAEFGNPYGRMGRSLGHEMTAVSFDFACASAGDAWGRELVQMADPSFRADWQTEDGIDAKKFAQAVVKKSWRIFAKNQGEDWVAALPYVYQMRWQRQAINRMYPGFKFSSDRGLNGGSWRLDSQGHITQSYASAGALDLQARFTGYNWYTLMYRDFYDTIGDGIERYQKTGELPSVHIPEHPVEVVTETVADSFRYVLKSAIKAVIYMTPAVPFFWATRTPQTKYKGVGFVLDPMNRENGGVAMMPNGQPFSHRDASAGFWTDGGYRMREGEVVKLNGVTPLPHSDFKHGFDPYAAQHVRGTMDKALNPLGRFTYNAGTNLYQTLKGAGLATVKHREFLHDWTNASISYTPYMIAKAETALRWDRKPMDDAIYRLIDGVLGMNLGEISGGFSDVREMVIHPPSNRKLEEIEAQAKEREAQKADQSHHETGRLDSRSVTSTTQTPPVTEIPRTTISLVSPEHHAALMDRLKHEVKAPSGATLH